MCSMLSAQVDKLRERAKELRSLAPDPAVPYLVPSTKETMALAMRSAASEMEDAADTIWELRGMMHKERAEADKLREELEAVGTAAYLYGRDDLKAENEKLRELLGDVGHTLFSLDVDYCGACKADNINHQCPVYTVDGGECLYKTAMRELGIEAK